MLQKIGKKISYYAVSADETTTCNGFSYVLDNGIPINISFTAKCVQQGEEKLLTALFDRQKSFEVSLNEKIKKFIRQYMDEMQAKVSFELLKEIE
ncbi:MAG TPA: hypothetical protein VD996_01475, partial [Chitinophagaceae bacterium]|nr:hypothetical protein [Chitinophagaceae bacterium]